MTPPYNHLDNSSRGPQSCKVNNLLRIFFEYSAYLDILQYLCEPLPLELQILSFKTATKKRDKFENGRVAHAESVLISFTYKLCILTLPHFLAVSKLSMIDTSKHLDQFWDLKLYIIIRAVELPCHTCHTCPISQRASETF